MVKTLSIALLILLTGSAVLAQEIIYEHYGSKVDFWLLIPYNSLNFKKGTDKATYQVSVTLTNSQKKQVGGTTQTLIIPKQDWLNDTGVPFLFTEELKPGRYGAQFQIRNKEMGDKRNFKRQFEIGEFSTEIGMTWILAKREGFQYIPSSLKALSAEELILRQSYSLELDSLRVNWGRHNLSVSNPESPVTLDISTYQSEIGESNMQITLFEKNIHYSTAPFLFSPWYAYSLRYTLEDQIAQLRYLATQNEWQVLRKLPKNKLSEAIEGFWKTHDPSPGTIRNETREQFYQRVLIADERYTIHKKLKGWNSDRGRIYIKYGEPDDISTNFYSVGSYPMVVWTYYREDRKFYFADTQGYGQYILRNKDEEY